MLTVSSRYLGVTVDSKVNWDAHLNSTVAKGNSNLGFVRWNILTTSEQVKSTLREDVSSGCSICLYDTAYQPSSFSLHCLQTVSGSIGGRIPCSQSVFYNRTYQLIAINWYVLFETNTSLHILILSSTKDLFLTEQLVSGMKFRLAAGFFGPQTSRPKSCSIQIFCILGNA